jgi:hypothetical protein
LVRDLSDLIAFLSAIYLPQTTLCFGNPRFQCSATPDLSEADFSLSWPTNLNDADLKTVNFSLHFSRLAAGWEGRVD